MDLNRRDVLAVAAAAGAAAFVAPARSEAAEGGLPPVKNLQILMKGLFIVDLSESSRVPFYFIRDTDHFLTLTCDLADLEEYPPGHSVAVDLEGRELATWRLNKQHLVVVNEGSSGVAFANSKAPTPDTADLYWVASVPDVTGVVNGKFQIAHASIGASLTVQDGTLVALAPSKPKGKCTWAFSSAAGKVTTQGVTDRVLYTSRKAATQLQISRGAAPWKFVNRDVRVTLASLPPATGDSGKLTHFPHLAKVFDDAVVPIPVASSCSKSAPLRPDEKRESGTAYCPPGKRP